MPLDSTASMSPAPDQDACAADSGAARSAAAASSSSGASAGSSGSRMVSVPPARSASASENDLDGIARGSSAGGLARDHAVTNADDLPVGRQRRPAFE